MKVQELDVIRLKNGQELTVLDVYHRNNGKYDYHVEDDNNIDSFVKEEDVDSIIWHSAFGIRCLPDVGAFFCNFMSCRRREFPVSSVDFSLMMLCVQQFTTF